MWFKADLTYFSEKKQGDKNILNDKLTIPFWEKLLLSVDEAAAYSGIGENRLRNYIKDNKHADFILWIGTHAKIKRPQFEKFICNLNYI